MSTIHYEKATFGGGCFWCTEALMQRLKGVKKVVSGYAGGTVQGTPTYKEVCSGLTGHAEVVQVEFDPKVISYHDLLTLFMASHDPTTLNRQGGDVGTQYRSVIFYLNEEQKKVAEKVVAEMSEYYEAPIVTEIAPMPQFYQAEDYHQEYYNNNAQQGYCQAVIAPKLAKLRQSYADMLQ